MEEETIKEESSPISCPENKVEENLSKLSDEVAAQTVDGSNPQLVEASVEEPDSDATDTSIVDEVKKNISNIFQEEERTESNGGGDPNAESTESTESFEFANGSDEESWESLSGQDIAEAEAATMMHQSGEHCNCAKCRQMVEVSSAAHSARVLERSTHSDTELPENVTKIETEHGSKIYLVGTAHFSEASKEDVAKTIQIVCPDVVMIELCRGRLSIIKYDEETLLREAKDLSVAKLRMAVKESGVVGGVMQLLLLSMSAHLTKQLGMAPGGEFRTAVQEANKVPGCQVMLGDRPVQITLSRAMAVLTFFQKLRMGWSLLTTRDPISKEDIEKFKEKDMLAQILAEMTGDFPLLSKVFVGERDLYMAEALRKAAKPVPVYDENGETCAYEPSVVVGVVGLGHVSGIKENYGTQVDVEELMKVPKPSKSTKVFKYSFRAILVAALSWSVYKIVRWTGIY